MDYDPNDRISGSENVILGNTILERIDYLESLVPSITKEQWEDLPGWVRDYLSNQEEFWGPVTELWELLAVKDAVLDLENASLINGGYMEEYAETLARDLHGSRVSPVWDYVDWKQFAEDLKNDYTSVEIGGNTLYAMFGAGWVRG